MLEKKIGWLNLNSFNFNEGLNILYGNWSNSLYYSNSLPALYDINISFSLGLSFAYLLFFIGLFGILWNKKNIIIMFLCIELMLFGVGLTFLYYWLFFNYTLGVVFALLILSIAAAETAIGLSIIILAYRLNRTIGFETFTVLKG